MALRLNATETQRVTVVDGLPASYTSFSAGFWFNIDAAAATAGVSPGLFTLVDGIVPDKGWLLQTDIDGRSLRVWNYGQGTPVIDTGVQLSTDVWYYVGLSVAGTGTDEALLWVYRLDNQVVSTYTGTANGTLTGSPGVAVLGYSGYGAEVFNGRFSHVRIWNVALREVDFALQAPRGRTVMPAFANSTVLHLPLMATVLADNTQSLTGGGATFTGANLSVEDGPPVSWGAAPIVVNRAAGAAQVMDAAVSASLTRTAAAFSTQVRLASARAASATATAPLTAQVRLAAARTATVTGSATLTSPAASLAATPSATLTRTTANLTNQARLAVVPTVQSLQGTPPLITQVRTAATPAVALQVSATLSSPALLAAVARVDAFAYLDTTRLSGNRDHGAIKFRRGVERMTVALRGRR